MPAARRLLLSLLVLSAAATVDAGIAAAAGESSVATAKPARTEPATRPTRARRRELESALRAEVVRTPVLAERIAYLIAVLGIVQKPLAQPVDFTDFTLVSAFSLFGEGGSLRGFRFRGLAGDRLLEVDMSFDGTGDAPEVQVRRWKPSGGYSNQPSRGRSRPLAAGELESLERILTRRARETRDAFDPSGLAAGIIRRQRESREASH